MSCYYCGKKVLRVQAVVDHIAPRRNASFNDEKNFVLIHASCNRRPKWYKRLWWAVRRFLRRWL